MGEKSAVASQTLLSLIARLQQALSVAQGRAMLLDYARKTCGARLALLFTLEPESHFLLLRDYSGRHPHPSAFAPETMRIEIALDGLFASAMQHAGLIDVPDITLNPLSLPEERAMAWPHGRVLLHALRQGTRQGVLVFCFSPAGSRIVSTSQSEDELLICSSLLSAYMGADEPLVPVRRVAEKPSRTSQPRRSKRPSKVQHVEEPEPVASTYTQVFEGKSDLLVALSELGLLHGPRLERQELELRLLDLFHSLQGVQATILWDFLPARSLFVVRTVIGDPGELGERASLELNALAGTLFAQGEGPTSGLLFAAPTDSRVLIWQLLRYRDQLLGAIGLLLENGTDEPTATTTALRHLLEQASEIAALILLSYEQRRTLEGVLLEQERGRIAREIHDSVMQDIAFVTQKLDYMQRVLEKQPQVALEELERVRTLLNRSLRDLRYSISSFLPVPLEEQEFDEALKALLHEYSLSTPHLKITCDMDNLTLWPQALQAAIYRFMQEALNNIRKHASASEVSIRIRHIAGLGIVQVSDNGQGFVLEEVRTSAAASLHMGLQTMEERIRQVGGVLEILSKPGEGTTLKARFSLSQSSAILTEREREVLRLLIEGLTNRAISARLSVSLETVKSHVHHIMQKMHVRDRTQAAVVATRQQWL
jgi:signal transduction histidine kinase